MILPNRHVLAKGLRQITEVYAGEGATETERQSRVAARSDENESAYSMLTVLFTQFGAPRPCLYY